MNATLPRMSKLVYVDRSMVIINKFAGEPVQTEDPTQHTVVQEWREKLGDPELQPAHRIDQPVSGLVVLSRNAGSFTSLQRGFAANTVERLYLAVVSTAPDPPEGALEDFIQQKGTRSVIGTEGKPASLHYRTIGKTDHHTILLVRLHTGRHHQIRVQLASRGWNVVGDARYGARRPLSDRSIALHAWRLTMDHPAFPGQTMKLYGDVPAGRLWQAVRTVILTLPAPDEVMAPLDHPLPR